MCRELVPCCTYLFSTGPQGGSSADVPTPGSVVGLVWSTKSRVTYRSVSNPAHNSLFVLSQFQVSPETQQTLLKGGDCNKKGYDTCQTLLFFERRNILHYRRETPSPILLITLYYFCDSRRRFAHVNIF